MVERIYNGATVIFVSNTVCGSDFIHFGYIHCIVFCRVFVLDRINLINIHSVVLCSPPLDNWRTRQDKKDGHVGGRDRRSRGGRWVRDVRWICGLATG